MNELTWTTDPPTQPGLYWYRRDSNDQPDIVLVQRRDRPWYSPGGRDRGDQPDAALVADDLKWLEYNPHDDESWYPLSPVGQWAGPLEPPK